MDKDVFSLFKKDIEGNKKTVLFLGVGINYS